MIWVLLIGLTFVAGLLCLVVALYQLTGHAGPDNQLALPATEQRDEAGEESEEAGRRTSLGRPIAKVRVGS